MADSCAPSPDNTVAFGNSRFRAFASRWVPGSVGIALPLVAELPGCEGSSIDLETASKAREARPSGRLAASIGLEATSIGRDAESSGRWPGTSFKSPNREEEPNAGLAAMRRPFAAVLRLDASLSAA